MKYLKLFEEHSKSIFTFKEVENLFNYFHVSSKLLLTNDKQYFTFHTKVPDLPYQDENGDIIEDNFTQRISLSNNIKGCLNSIGTKTGYLYGIDLKQDINDDIKTINLKQYQTKCPCIKVKNFGTINYGEDFNLTDWILNLNVNDKQFIIKYLNYKHNIKFKSDLKKFNDEISPELLPSEFKELFFACVPDADKHNEFWSNKNLKMIYLGKILNDGSIITSDIFKRILNHLDSIK